MPTITPNTYRYARLGPSDTKTLIYVESVNDYLTVHCRRLADRIVRGKNMGVRWTGDVAVSFGSILNELPSEKTLEEVIAIAGLPTAQKPNKPSPVKRRVDFL